MYYKSSSYSYLLQKLSNYRPSAAGINILLERSRVDIFDKAGMEAGMDTVGKARMDTVGKG
jgi:hypothetical protein